MKEVGREWQELDHEGRQKFQVKADQDKIRFKREKANFESKMKKFMTNPDAFDAENENIAIIHRKKQKSKRGRPPTQDQKSALRYETPKKNVSPFIHYSRNERLENAPIKSCQEFRKLSEDQK